MVSPAQTSSAWNSDQVVNFGFLATLEPKPKSLVTQKFLVVHQFRKVTWLQPQHPEDTSDTDTSTVVIIKQDTWNWRGSSGLSTGWDVINDGIKSVPLCALDQLDHLKVKRFRWSLWCTGWISIGHHPHPIRWKSSELHLQLFFWTSRWFIDFVDYNDRNRLVQGF